MGESEGIDWLIDKAHMIETERHSSEKEQDLYVQLVNFPTIQRVDISYIEEQTTTMQQLAALSLLLFFPIIHAFLGEKVAHRPIKSLLYQSVINDVLKSAEDSLKGVHEERGPHLIFPGGGLFFYWQAGIVSYLREQGYDLDKITVSGASAGALTATLTATCVDFYKATELALQMSEEAGVWDRPSGLQGIWGPIIYEWLDRLLPENAVEMVNGGRLSLLVTPIPQFGKEKVSEFMSRGDLIQCNMASVHLPCFLDGNWATQFRGQPHIDGSFLAKANDYLPSHPRRSIIRLDWGKDPAFQGGGFFDFVRVVSPDKIWEILEKGKQYAKSLEENGKLASLPKKIVLPESL